MTLYSYNICMLRNLLRLRNLVLLCRLWLQPFSEPHPPLLSWGNLYLVSSHADYSQQSPRVCVCVIVLIVMAQLCAPWGTSPNNRVIHEARLLLASYAQILNEPWAW